MKRSSGEEEDPEEEGDGWRMLTTLQMRSRRGSG